MRTLDRYVATLFLRNLALILAVLISLYGLIEFVEKVDDFIENQAALLHYLRYPFYHLPFMLGQSLPMGTLLAAFVTIGELSRSSQITALRSCGIGLGQLTRPLFACGGLLCVFTLLSNAWLAPWSARESRYILATELKGKTATAQTTQNLYFRDSRRIIGAAQSFPDRGELRGLTLMEFDDRFHLTRRVEATTARYWKDTDWVLTDAIERRFDPATQSLAGFMNHRQISMNLGRKPEEMIDLWYKPEEMSLPELLRLDEKLQVQGGDPLPYRAEWQRRLASSLTPLLMVLTGIPFALHRGRKASVGLGVGVSLAAFAGYFACQAISMALGMADMLPLPLAVWTANALLLLIGSWLFLTLDN